MDTGEATNISPKPITGLDRQGRAVLKLKSDHLHELNRDEAEVYLG